MGSPRAQRRKRRRQLAISFTIQYLRKHGPTNQKDLTRAFNREVPSVQALRNNALGMLLRGRSEIERELIWISDATSGNTRARGGGKRFIPFNESFKYRCGKR
jgi:hypothetical protein